MNRISSRLYDLLIEAGKAKSRGTRSLEDTNYIFNNLLDDMKNTKSNSLFNSQDTKKAKSFYDTYISNMQLNDEGIKLANTLEPHIINWLQRQNIDPLKKDSPEKYIYYISDLINRNNNFLKNYISINDFDEYFEDDFKTFIEYVCAYLYNKDISEFKSLLFKNIKPNYQVTEDDINIIADNIYSWYNNNFKTIYHDYIFNQSFNLKSFLIKKWENEINKIYDLLAINSNMYSSSLKKTIKHAINTAIDIAISNYQFPVEYKVNKNADLEKSILKKIEDNYESVLEYIKFPKEKNGIYKHSWLGKIGTRKDAKPIIQYLSINPQFAEQIFNIDINKIEKKSKMPWKEFILQAYRNNYNEEFELKVRQYLVEKNIPIHNNTAEKILTNGDEVGQKIKIKDTPKKDQNRSYPAILIYSFKDNKNHLLVGAPGSNHGSIYQNPEYSDILNNCCHPNDIDKRYSKLVHVYILGTLAFIARPGQEYNGYNNIQQVANILIKDPKIDKVYTLPNKSINGFSTRLAKLIY